MDRLAQVSEADDNKEEIWEWRLSQARWHYAQAKPLKDGKVRRWHHRQGRIYSIGVSITYVVSKTLQRHSESIAANVMRNNPLFERLTKGSQQ